MSWGMDQFRELRYVAEQYGYRALVEHLSDPRVMASLGYRARHRWSPLVVVAMALLLILPTLYLGTQQVQAVRVGPTWVRAVQPPAAVDCAASNVVCSVGNTSTRISLSGTSNKVYDGKGFTSVGLTLTGANHVVIQNFKFTNCASNCIYVEGDDLTIQHNEISQVFFDGDDIDGMRFFGDDITIRANRAFDILSGPKSGAHLDCFQTWSSPSKGPSSNILVEGNDCDDPNFHQCLMAEGPGSTDGGGGSGGNSQDWVVRGNYYACYANQTMAFRDIENVLIEDNNLQGSGAKAIQLTDGSTATIRNNILGPNYGTLVGD